VLDADCVLAAASRAHVVRIHSQSSVMGVVMVMVDSGQRWGADVYGPCIYCAPTSTRLEGCR
jgi:hypothetical protein